MIPGSDEFLIDLRDFEDPPVVPSVAPSTAATEAPKTEEARLYEEFNSRPFAQFSATSGIGEK